MDSQANAAYFDQIAHQWDGWENIPEIRRKLAAGLETMDIEPGETLIDIGCGTGNIALGLLERLSPEGRVIAVDVSPRMIEIARAKTTDPRIEWHVADAYLLPISDASVDRVFCCQVWPHFDDHPRIARELYRVLRPNGFLHVWHFKSRAQINRIHADGGEALGKDRLAPAHMTAELLSQAGFQTLHQRDDDQGYLVTVRKKGA